MFCKKCGTENLDGVKFCKGCGEMLVTGYGNASQNESYQSTVSNFAVPPAVMKKKIGSKTIGLIACGAGLIAVVVIVTAIFSGGAERVAKNYIRALFSGNVEKAFDYKYLAFNKYMEDRIVESSGEEFEDYKDYLDTIADEIKDGLEDQYGKNARITKIEVKDTDELSTKEAKDMMETYESEEMEDYLKAKDYSKIVEFDFGITAKGSDDEDTNDMTFYMIKSGSKWYVLSDDSGMGFSVF